MEVDIEELGGLSGLRNLSNVEEISSNCWKGLCFCPSFTTTNRLKGSADIGVSRLPKNFHAASNGHYFAI